MLRSGLVAAITLAAAFAAVPIGCAASDGALDDTNHSGEGGATSSAASGTLCIPGKQDTCPCPGGEVGVQACSADGLGYDPCVCEGGSSSISSGGDGGAAPCGDGVCIDEGENCHTCPADCGFCDPCTIAPSCDNAQIPPVSLTHLNTLDVTLQAMSNDKIMARLERLVAEAAPGVRILAEALSAEHADEHPFVTNLRKTLAAKPHIAAALRKQLGRAGLTSPALFARAYPDLLPRYSALGNEFPGGTVECGSPLLRLRVAQVTVHEEDDDFANDIVYCSVVTEALNGTEVRVTPQTPNLDEGDSFSYPIEQGVMWGQLGPETPGGNMLITYDCFEADTNDGYQNLIDSIGQGAGQIGGVVGTDGYGWVFTGVAALAPVVSSALALDGDDHLFNATQTIPLDMQLDMTNGRFWTVRRSGTHLLSDWDWELRIEGWGCAEYGTL